MIGSRLSSTLRVHGISVIAASLRNPEEAAQRASDADVIVNLAGESIAQRWTPDVKLKIRESRVDLPRRFLQALSKHTIRAKQYITASAIGYYGTSLSNTFDEKSPAGSGFLADVCVSWEHEALSAIELGMTLTIVRSGIVCAPEGGVIASILPFFRSGLGGPIGDGKQWYSWIHIDDAVGIYLHALDGVEGVLNATAPQPVTNQEFTTAVASALGKPAFLTIPPFALKLKLGEGASVALEGQRVIPTRTLTTGYSFRHPEIKGTMQSLLGHH